MKRGKRKQSLKPADFKSKRLPLGEKKCGEKPASGNRVDEMRFCLSSGVAQQSHLVAVTHVTAVYIMKRETVCKI